MRTTATVTIALAFLGNAATASSFDDVITIDSITGNADCTAKCRSEGDGDPCGRDQVVDTDSAIIDSIDDLPINLHVEADCTGNSSGEVDLNMSFDSTDTSFGFGISVDTDTDWIWDDPSCLHGSASGEGTLDMTFSVKYTVLVRATLIASAYAGDPDTFGCCGYANFKVNGKELIYADSHHSQDGWVEIEVLLLPGDVCEVHMDAGTGGEGNGADSSCEIEVLCPADGALALGETPFDTTPAVGDFIDLDGHCDFVFGGHQAMFNLMYYSFTPDCNDVYTFSTCNTAEFDTRIAILEGTCEPSATLTCNDDAEGCEGYTSELDAVLEAGRNYVVVLGGYWEDEFGMGTLRVSRDCPTDFNNDGQVDAADLGLLLADWGNAGETDANCDGTTDAADLGIVLAGWGKCGVTNQHSDV